MSQRRSQILQAARMAGAAWHGSFTVRKIVQVEAPQLAKALDELWELTKVAPVEKSRKVPGQPC